MGLRRGGLILLCLSAFAGCEGDPLESDPVDSGPTADATTDGTTGEVGGSEVGPDVGPDAPDTSVDTAVAEAGDADAIGDDADAIGDDADAIGDDADAIGDDADATGDDADATGDDADATGDDADATGDDADTSVVDAATDGDETGAGDTGDAETGSDDADAPAPVSAEVWVVRVGDGVTELDATAAPVSLERVRLSDGALVGEISLPITTSGADHALLLSGSNIGQGVLLRSADERYVTMLGFDISPGGDTSATGVGHTIARIDAAGLVDTTTTTTSYGAVAHAAVTLDGAQYWLAGTDSTGGIRYIGSHGASGAATSISTGLTTARSVNIVSGALVGANSAGSLRVFDFGGGLPTTATAPTSMPGFPTTSAISPSAVVGVPGAPDVVYVCGPGSASAAVQRWKKTSGSWALDDSLSMGLANGCRGLAVAPTTGGVRIVVGENSPNSRIFTTVDTGVGTPTFTELRAAPSKTAYRGVAFAPK